MSPVAGHSPHGVGKAAVPDGKGHPRHQPPIQPRTHVQQAASHHGVSRAGAPIQPMTPTATDDSRGSEVGSNSGVQAGYYPPGYQAHLEQLGEWRPNYEREKSLKADRAPEREYDAHGDMLDDGDPSDTSNGPGSSGPGPYPHSYHPQQNMPPGTAVPMGMQGQAPMQPMPPQMHPQQVQQQRQPVDPNNPMYGVMNQNFDPYDPNLDADPFGLTASMHFPTQFTYQEGVKRR